VGAWDPEAGQRSHWTVKRAPMEGTGEGWEALSALSEDIVLSKRRPDDAVSSVKSAGFLGLGDKLVLMPVENVRLTWQSTMAKCVRSHR